MFKTTIEIYSEFDPIELEIDIDDLTREATHGNAICGGYRSCEVGENNLPPIVRNFFDIDNDSPFDDY